MLGFGNIYERGLEWAKLRFRVAESRWDEDSISSTEQRRNVTGAVSVCGQTQARAANKVASIQSLIQSNLNATEDFLANHCGCIHERLVNIQLEILVQLTMVIRSFRRKSHSR